MSSPGIKCFISHRWAEGEHYFAKALKARLTSYEGLEPILDEEHLLPGDRVSAWMERAVREGTDVFLIVLSPHAVASSNVLFELRTALAKGVPIIPVYLRPCSIPEELSDIFYADFRDNHDLPFAIVDRLVKGIRRQAKPRANPPDESEPILGPLEALGVPDIEIGQLFLGGPLPERRLHSEYIDRWVEQVPPHRSLLSELLEAERKRAKAEGKTFDNNLGYSLRRIDVSRPQTADGQRENHYTLQLYPSDYESFIVPNSMWRKEVWSAAAGQMQPLWRALALPERMSLAELDGQPLHFRVGAGCMIETCDGYWVLSIRSAKQLIAGATTNREVRFHLSTAEGMVRVEGNGPHGDVVDGMPTPFQTVVRALRDELGLVAGDHFDRSALGCMGYFLDRSRVQPFFIFALRDTSLTLRSVLEIWGKSPVDRFENRAVFGVPATLDSAVKLLASTPIGDLQLKGLRSDLADVITAAENVTASLASNHAATGLGVIALDRFGADAVTRAFAAARTEKREGRAVSR